jgi:hypothetical protein
MNEVPDPSDRCTTMMSVAGSFTPGLSAAMRVSFHLVIRPRKTAARVPPSKRSGVFPSCGRL